MLKEFKTLGPYIKLHWYRYALGILCLLAVDSAQLLIPQYIRKSIDAVSMGKSGHSVVVFALWIVAVAAFVAAGRFAWRFFIHGASRRIEKALRDRLFSHLMLLPASYFQQSTVGDLMARATNDMQAVRMACGMAFVSFVDGIFMSFAILLVMFSQNPGTTVWTVAPLPIVTVLIIFFGKAMGKRFKKVQEIYSSMSTVVQETMQGIRVVKSFVKEDVFASRFAEANDKYRAASMGLVKIFGFFFPMISFIAGITSVILLLAGGEAVLENRMTPGDLAAMLAYLEMLLWPMLGAGFTVNILQRGAASLKRINEVLNNPVEPARAPGAVPCHKAPRGDIEFRNLSLTFPDAKAPALLNVSLTIRQGETTGILGRIGSGKSTLMKLIPRIVEPPLNAVFIGGIEVGAFDIEQVRAMLGFVPQDSFLFSDSIRNNIVFAKPDIGEARFLRVLAISALERDMDSFPAGWDTVVGERGLTLSGGQKQRVAIARALAAEPEILVFDDALSAVDADTEEKILEKILEDRAGRTNIIISNRVSTLKRAQKVAVFDGGKLTQWGTPEQLARSDGFFAEIAAMQELSRAPAGRKD